MWKVAVSQIADLFVESAQCSGIFRSARLGLLALHRERLSCPIQAVDSEYLEGSRMCL